MPGYIRTFLPFIFIGLLGIPRVHGIDGDLGNPYADAASQAGNVAVTYDGTLDYGGRYAEIPLITSAGGVILVLGLIISATVLVKDKKRKLHVD